MDSTKKGGQGRPILGAKQGGNQPAQSNLSVAAKEFVPRVQQVHQPSANGDGPDKRTPVQKLHELICKMTSDPAYFQQGLGKIAEGFGSSVKDEQTLIDVVNELVEQCIEEPNFRYTGARICQAFSTDLKVGFETGNFRQHLLKRVHHEHQHRGELGNTLSGKKRLVGLTMFIGELLLHMRVGKPKKRISVLSTAVLELVQTCLDNPDELTIKNAVQVLKLTGCIVHHMEKESDKENKTPRLDAVISRLKSIVVEDTYPRNIRGAMLKLIEERVTWDEQEMEEPSSDHAQTQADTQVPFTNEPTFYNAVGQVITAEEAGFAPGEYDDGYCGFDQGFEYQDDFDPSTYETEEITEAELQHYLHEASGDSTNEWDDEIASAYEEFLLNQQNEAHNRAPNYR